MDMELTSIPYNFGEDVKLFIRHYSSLSLAFQKEVIQNAVGARKGEGNNWENWNCDISIRETKFGVFIVIEDKGTHGLTGPNLTTHEIKKREKLGVEERLARFMSMHNSGENTGPGLFGYGKLAYAAASETCTYYFDSLREDGVYVANFNRAGEVLSLAKEGDEAKKFILEGTGFSEKTTVGTRIIIDSPKKELIDSINNRAIVSLILESWWRTILRLPRDASITVNGERVIVPKYRRYFSNLYEPRGPIRCKDGYEVKHFGFGVFRDEENEGNWLRGISYYRKGMKITEIPEVEFKDMPKELEGRIFAYIELNEKWEKDLEKIEDPSHCGITKGGKQQSQYKHIKNFIWQMMEPKLIEWGYMKQEVNENTKENDELRVDMEEIQDFLSKDLGLEDLEHIPQKKNDFNVKWQHVIYPNADTKRVSSGDGIRFAFEIQSRYSTNKKFTYKLDVKNRKNGDTLSSIAKGSIHVAANSTASKEFLHTVTDQNSKQFAKNVIVLTVTVTSPKGQGPVLEKELPYFYDIDQPNESRDKTVSLKLHECVFPVENSHRVNFGEALRSVSYLISNERPYKLNYRLNISIHNGSIPNCPKIVDVDSFIGEIDPFKEKITSPIDKIVFEQQRYGQYLSEGVIELRAMLIANDDDPEYIKGDIIILRRYKVYLNCDEKKGLSNSYDAKSVFAPENFRQAWHRDRTIFINVGHHEYKSYSRHPDLQRAYQKRLMLREAAFLYLSEGKHDKLFGDDFSELDSQEAAERALDTIERLYFWFASRGKEM